MKNQIGVSFVNLFIIVTIGYGCGPTVPPVNTKEEFCGLVRTNAPIINENGWVCTPAATGYNLGLFGKKRNFSNSMCTVADGVELKSISSPAIDIKRNVKVKLDTSSSGKADLNKSAEIIKALNDFFPILPALDLKSNGLIEFNLTLHLTNAERVQVDSLYRITSEVDESTSNCVRNFCDSDSYISNVIYGVPFIYLNFQANAGVNADAVIDVINASGNFKATLTASDTITIAPVDTTKKYILFYKEESIQEQMGDQCKKIDYYLQENMEEKLRKSKEKAEKENIERKNLENRYRIEKYAECSQNRFKGIKDTAIKNTCCEYVVGIENNLPECSRNFLGTPEGRLRYYNECEEMRQKGIKDGYIGLGCCDHLSEEDINLFKCDRKLPIQCKTERTKC